MFCRFYNKYPCIIITAKGQPDVATRCVWLGPKGCFCLGIVSERVPVWFVYAAAAGVGRLFLRKVKMTLNLPVLGLVDSDPYGM